MIVFALVCRLLCLRDHSSRLDLYSEQAAHHRNASARYQALFNAMDQSLAFPPQKEQDLSDWRDKLRDRWDELNLEAPSVPYNLPGQQVRRPNQAGAEPEPESSATADDA